MQGQHHLLGSLADAYVPDVAEGDDGIYLLTVNEMEEVLLRETEEGGAEEAVCEGDESVHVGVEVFLCAKLRRKIYMAKFCRQKISVPVAVNRQVCQSVKCQSVKLEFKFCVSVPIVIYK